MKMTKLRKKNAMLARQLAEKPSVILDMSNITVTPGDTLVSELVAAVREIARQHAGKRPVKASIARAVEIADRIEP